MSGQSTTTESSREPPPNDVPRPATLLERLHRALGPLAGGIIIDCVDLVFFGPIGVVLGPIVGGLAGWWVSSIYGFGVRGRAIVALAAGIYVTLPFTELFPLATLVAAVARFREAPPNSAAPRAVAPEQPPPASPDQAN